MTDAQCVAIIAAVLSGRRELGDLTIGALMQAAQAMLNEAQRQCGEPPKMETKDVNASGSTHREIQKPLHDALTTIRDLAARGELHIPAAQQVIAKACDAYLHSFDWILNATWMDQGDGREAE